MVTKTPKKPRLRVRKKMCATCPFRKEGWTEVRGLLEQRALSEASPICHSTGSGLKRPDGNVKSQICRGARNYQLMIFYRLGFIEAQTDAAWEKKAREMNR